MRKILYSPGFGAGWTTWHYGTREEKEFMLTYQPFINALERGERIIESLEEQFMVDFQSKFPDASDSTPYTGGLRDLTVREVAGRVHIDEYDGSESVEEEFNQGDDYWL